MDIDSQHIWPSPGFPSTIQYCRSKAWLVVAHITWTGYFMFLVFSNILLHLLLVSTTLSNSQNILPIPAVHGVGPTTSMASSGPSPPHPALHPWLGWLIIEKGQNWSGKTSRASDVWYFVHSLQSHVHTAMLPESEPASEVQPNPANFTHFGCQLCE